MRTWFWTTLICLLTLFTEVALDSSTAFVRTAGENTVEKIWAAAGVTSTGTPDSGIPASNEDYTWSFNSASHSAEIVRFDFFPTPLLATSLTHPSPLVYLDPPLGSPHRPPIA